MDSYTASYGNRVFDGDIKLSYITSRHLGNARHIYGKFVFRHCSKETFRHGCVWMYVWLKCMYSLSVFVRLCVFERIFLEPCHSMSDRQLKSSSLEALCVWGKENNALSPEPVTFPFNQEFKLHCLPLEQDSSSGVWEQLWGKWFHIKISRNAYHLITLGSTVTGNRMSVIAELTACTLSLFFIQMYYKSVLPYLKSFDVNVLFRAQANLKV